MSSNEQSNTQPSTDELRSLFADMAREWQNEKASKYELPPTILSALETIESDTSAELKRFQKDLIRYEGGQWTKMGAVNPFSIQELKRASFESNNIVQQRYRDAEQLRATGRAATELFEELEQILEIMAETSIEEISGGSRVGEHGSAKVFTSTSGGIETRTRRSFSVKIIHDKGKEKGTPHSRLYHDQQIYSTESLQDGGLTSLTGDDRTGGFYGQNRPQGCLYGGPNSSSIKEVPLIRTSRPDLPVLGITFRYEYCTACLLKINAVCIRAFTEDGHASCILLGRHLRGGTEQNTIEGPCTEVDLSPTRLRLHPQLEEECIDTNETTNVLGIPIRHTQDDDQGSGRKDGEVEAESEAGSSDHIQLQMDRWFTGEDDEYDSSSWRSSTSGQISTEGPSAQSSVHRHQWDRPCKLIPNAIKDLQWWMNNQAYLQGLPIRTPPPETPKITIHVDASDTGWGVTSPILEKSGFWHAEEKDLSINVRELRTIRFALQLHAEKCRNSTILLMSDNKTALKYAFKQGGTASAILQEEALRIHDLCNEYKMRVTFQHIAGIHNVVF